MLFYGMAVKNGLSVSDSFISLKQAGGKVCVLKLDASFLTDLQMEKSIMQLDSDHEDEVPLKDEGTALWKPGSDHEESVVDLPLRPDSSGYVQTGQIPSD